MPEAHSFNPTKGTKIKKNSGLWTKQLFRYKYPRNLNFQNLKQTQNSNNICIEIQTSEFKPPSWMMVFNDLQIIDGVLKSPQVTKLNR